MKGNLWLQGVFPPRFDLARRALCKLKKKEERVKKKMSCASGNKRSRVENLTGCFDYLQTDLFCGCQDFDFLVTGGKKNVIIPSIVAVNCDDDAINRAPATFLQEQLKEAKPGFACASFEGVFQSDLTSNQLVSKK